MAKFTSSDIIAVLRRFDLATADNVPRHVEQVKFSTPDPENNTLVSFRFNKQWFYILLDATAEDDVDYVMEQIKSDKQDIVGELLKNPNDHITTYALPFKGKEVYLYVQKSDKQRLDTTLAEQYPDTSRSTWQKHVKAGHVTVNGELELSPKRDVLTTDKIAIAIPDATDYNSEELPIIYIDENVIVINKPVGVLTHAKGALNDEFTVAEFFRRYTTLGLDTNRPGIVHRLDRDTSGVMIGARNPETATMLQKQFADRKTKKSYLAVVVGELKNSEAKVDLPINRNPSAPSTFRVDPKGKSAVTYYNVLAVHPTESLVKLSPVTGRTHQLRVHMTYLGCPIVGDRVYGKASDRLYLHAAELEVTIPGGDRRIFVAPIPTEFKQKFPEVSL